MESTTLDLLQIALNKKSVRAEFKGSLREKAL
jgi:hypothetical protein